MWSRIGMSGLSWLWSRLRESASVLAGSPSPLIRWHWESSPGPMSSLPSTEGGFIHMLPLPWFDENWCHCSVSSESPASENVQLYRSTLKGADATKWRGARAYGHSEIDHAGIIRLATTWHPHLPANRIIAVDVVFFFSNSVMTKRYRALVNAGPLTKCVFVSHGRVTRHEPEPHKFQWRPSCEIIHHSSSSWKRELRDPCWISKIYSR